jgi:hypothetical protein
MRSMPLLARPAGAPRVLRAAAWALAALAVLLAHGLLLRALWLPPQEPTAATGDRPAPAMQVRT